MPPINFNHLYYFYEVARHGSFTRASRELLVSQSTLSVQIKNLEGAIGTALFDRRKGGVELTESGVQAFQVAERVFQDVDQLLSDLQATERQYTGAVSIGTVNSIGIYMLPKMLGAFREACPGVRVRIDFEESERVIDLVDNNKVDFAITSWRGRYPELESVQLARNKMFLVGLPDHPLANRESPSPRELEPHVFVGYKEGMHTRAMIDSILKRLSLSVEYAIESANAATIKHMVLAGMGLGFLPEMAISGELRRGQLVRIEIPALTISQEVMLYYHRNRTLSRTRSEFLEFLRRYFERPARRRT